MKRIAIAELTPRQLDWGTGVILETGKPLGVPVTLIHDSRAILAAHHPSGYVEIPDALLEKEKINE